MFSGFYFQAFLKFKNSNLTEKTVKSEYFILKITSLKKVDDQAKLIRLFQEFPTFQVELLQLLRLLFQHNLFLRLHI